MFGVVLNCFGFVCFALTIITAEDDTLWRPPYFRDAQVDGINFSDTQNVVLHVQEELNVSFTLVYINYKGGFDNPKVRPTIGRFSTGNNNLLNASIEHSETDWFVQINTRQDYEQSEQRLYIFQIYISDENGQATPAQTVRIQLENIFDNAPDISYDGPCKAKELQSNILTNCTFTVRDLDGMKNNKITIDVVDNNNEKEYFSFVNETETPYTVTYRLKILKELQYDQKALYNFNVIASDIANNTGILNAVILEVINVPHKLPIWVQPLVTATFKEKEAQEFSLKAIDGDTGINKRICYKLKFDENQNYSDIMRINEDSGLLSVDEIDRDSRKQEIFQLLTCAFKCENVTSELCSQTTLIIEDINDNLPIINISPTKLQIPENISMEISLNEFTISDIDLATHATYDVFLDRVDENAINYSVAFDVIPKSGYQIAKFQLIVSNKNFLDYENPEWRNTVVRIIARETYFPENFTIFDLPIDLINWNDEVPIFTENIYKTSVLETLGKNEIIENVFATDRDVNDTVTHEIVGDFYGIAIHPINGTVYTTIDRAFDYERLKVVIIQIKAIDSLKTDYSQKLNEVITQLTINVIDVNDKTPELRMPATTPNITENSVGGTLITDMIIGTDPDTTANLTFEIDWSKTKATKAGRLAVVETYENCFIIETHIDPETNNRAFGHLKVNPNFEYEVDYEKYDNIYLLIRLIDQNQEVNDGFTESTLTVIIDDVNDNPPEFVAGTLNETRFVIEEAAPQTLVGTIYAFDIDGPGNNEIEYNIEPFNGTSNGIIEIEATNGELRVMTNAIIDCDIPKIYYYYFTIILSDGEHETRDNIKINVIDKNNKIPKIEYFPNPVEIYEKSPDDTFVGYVNASDADRDAPHNILQYLLSFSKFPELEKFFRIDQKNGKIYVKLFGAELDRDNGVTEHMIHVDIFDNFNDPKNGVKNTNDTSLLVILLDINDNAPELPKPDKFQPEISENSQKNMTIEKPKLIAPDKDQPNHPNSEVSYRILKIKPGEDCDPSIKDHDVFGIRGDDKVYGQIYTKRDLRGYYGSWFVQIEAYDHGEPRMASNETYIVKVSPFNFNDPKIVFPTKEIIRLSHKQTIGRPLYNTDATQLRDFEAHDPDGGDYGNVTFELSNYSGDDSDYFKMIKETTNKSRLEITKQITTRFYRINVKAKDGGGKTDELKNVSIVFIDMEGDPIFELEDREFETNFTETDLGLEEEREIPEAYDPKNQGITNEEDFFKIYYFIDYNFNPEHANYFKLDNEKRILKLQHKLNRTAIDLLNFRIIATNNKNEPSTNPNMNSILQITITVNDVNDNPPTFVEHKYGSGITTRDYVKKKILTVHATDPDLDDPTTYLMNDKIDARGENIEEIKNKMFQLNDSTGELLLMFVPKDNMKGYFEFNITAIDTANHTDEANVKIYIIAEVNRISFIFLSPIAVVEQNEIFLRDTLEKVYEYDRCNIDSIANTTDVTSRQASDNVTNIDSVSVLVHFIKNNEAIEASEIQKKSDTNLITKLKKTLGNKGLILDNIENYANKEVVKNLEELLKTILIVVSVVLSTLCIVIVILFVLKTRALNRQLKAFAPTEFGSQASNLNRIGAPTTNVFSVEGSNPVINNNAQIKDNFDASSIDSDGSDFVGINNDPTFMMNNESHSSKNSSLISNYDRNLSKTNDSRDEDGNPDEDEQYKNDPLEDVNKTEIRI